MIRPKLSLRRPLAAAGAALVGLAAAVAMQSPASAHHSEVVGKFECNTTTGEYVGTWTLNNYAIPGVDKYKLTFVEAKQVVGNATSDVTIPGIAVDSGDPEFPRTVGTFETEQLRYPGNTTRLSLHVRSEWENGVKEEGEEPKGDVVDLAGNCTAPEPAEPPKTAKPDATVNSQCDGSVVVTLTNGKDATADAEFVVTGSKGFRKEVRVESGSATVTVPAENAEHIKVAAEGVEKALFDAAPTQPKDCVKPGEPSGGYESTCDELIFMITNPEDGKTVTVTFTPNKGEPKTVTVEPGKTETVKFAAQEGLTVKPSAEGMDETEPIAWEKPADCPSGGEGGGSLPVTGAAAGTIAGGAALLLIIGGVLFFVARRRRVTFTA